MGNNVSKSKFSAGDIGYSSGSIFDQSNNALSSTETSFGSSTSENIVKVTKKRPVTDKQVTKIPSLPEENDDTLDGLPKADFASAVNLDGLCIDMCSPAERELHIRVDELSVFEKSSPSVPLSQSELIVKRFQRSSAWHKLDIPEEIRPLGVLRMTQLYLEQNIMDRERLGIDDRINPPRVPDLIDVSTMIVVNIKPFVNLWINVR